jgi:hypothetical protein
MPASRASPATSRRQVCRISVGCRVGRLVLWCRCRCLGWRFPHRGRVGAARSRRSWPAPWARRGARWRAARHSADARPHTNAEWHRLRNVGRDVQDGVLPPAWTPPEYPSGSTNTSPTTTNATSATPRKATTSASPKTRPHRHSSLGGYPKPAQRTASTNGSRLKPALHYQAQSHVGSGSVRQVRPAQHRQQVHNNDGAEVAGSAQSRHRRRVPLPGQARQAVFHDPQSSDLSSRLSSAVTRS